MDSIEKDLEATIQDSGFDISTEAPEGFNNVEEPQAPATVLEGIEPDFDLSANNETPEPQPEATEQVEEAVTEEPTSSRGNC